jgi:hypothetical protein
MEGEGRVLTPRERAGLELQAGLLMHVFVVSEQRPRRPVSLTDLTDIPELGDDAELRRWVEQAAAVARSLPPKAKT